MDLAPLAHVCDRPVVLWVPECLEPGQKPRCIVSGCICTPRVKEYNHELNIDAKVNLLYVKHQCLSSNGCCFSTISPAYLHTSPETPPFSPYVTCHKTGYTKDLMEMVQDGVTSPSGLARVIESIRRRRQTRYYKLYSIFCDRVRHLRDANPVYMMPSPPTYSQYCESYTAPSDHMMSSVWLEMTMIWSSIAENP
ncbi:LOW QUALITY PROTEIN: hypothetical protein PHMEG_00018033 [Phytophthora megakarya]|uniref:Uncharacterized protein n=1 Tax=Phytophthora megakarya TaxID=4795 RepID=A0A225VV28_9STRA|nr:LOW QUALITY PROTEIN: hypothetical protein PHMEG_00018033 [Phytophthora megakarya]